MPLLFGNDIIAWAAKLKQTQQGKGHLYLARSERWGVAAMLYAEGEMTVIGQLGPRELEIRPENGYDKLCRLPCQAADRARHRLLGIVKASAEGFTFGA